MEQKQNMKHVMPFLKKQKPDIFVIRVSGNNINYKNKDNVSVTVLTSEILPKKSIAVTSIKRKVKDQAREYERITDFILFLINILPEIFYIMMESIRLILLQRS